MKRTITIALAIMTIATIALAQQPRRMGPHGGPGGPSGGPPPRELAEFLGLTSDQQTQIDALHQSLRTTIDPLMEQKRAADDQLHALVDVASPDPTAVGKQFLAMHAIDEDRKSTRLNSSHVK